MTEVDTNMCSLGLSSQYMLMSRRYFSWALLGCKTLSAVATTVQRVSTVGCMVIARVAILVVALTHKC